VAGECGYSVPATMMLLNACTALKLCVKEAELFHNAPLTQRYLLKEQADYLGGFLNHFNDHMYPAWFYLEDAVKTGHAQIQRVVGDASDHFFQAIDHQAQDLETFMATMEEHSLMEGRALAAAYDFSNHRELLDIGGGTGAMTVSILKAYPHLRATLFDRPPVCEIAKRNLAKHGLTDRVRVVPGDFFSDPIPQTADVALLSGILHNWSPENAARILTQAAGACRAGVRFLVSEQVLNESKTEPLPGVLCSLNMLVMMDGGQEYSASDFRNFLTHAGFQLDEIRPTGTVRQLLIAHRN
jgi:precorrin-6B methylase 2